MEAQGDQAGATEASPLREEEQGTLGPSVQPVPLNLGGALPYPTSPLLAWP